MKNDDLYLSKAPLLAHLIELRRRLLYCLVLFTLAFAGAYYFAEQIYAFLVQPLQQAMGPDAEQRRMIYTGLHEAFFTYLKLAFFTAAFFSIPLVLIQLWKFIAPGLYIHERKSLIPLFAMTPILFLTGASLAFFLVMPLAWEFFISFETLGENGAMSVQLEAKVSEYLGLVIQLVLAFGLSFELPILLLVLAKIGVVTRENLKEYRRHAVVIVFLVAAFITPPDIISQLILGIPIVLLYELSIWLIRWTGADETGRSRAKAIQY